MPLRLTAAQFRVLQSGGGLSPAKRHKYGARASVVLGRAFESGAEGGRYQQLVCLEQAGQIRDLRTQPEFLIFVNGVYVCKYVADFAYRDQSDQLVVEDVKSPKTRTLRGYRIKVKLLRAVFGLEVVEVMAPWSRRGNRGN